MPATYANVQAVYKGTTEIIRIFSGSTMVWEKPSDEIDEPVVTEGLTYIEITSYPASIVAVTNDDGETSGFTVTMNDGRTYSVPMSMISGRSDEQIGNGIAYLITVSGVYDNDWSTYTTLKNNEDYSLSFSHDTSTNELIITAVAIDNPSVMDQVSAQIEGTTLCLSGNTLITMFDGSQKRLDELVVGDYVFGKDGVKSKVLRIDSGEFSDYYTTYKFANGTIIEETANHRFFNAEQGFWQRLRDWKIGEHAIDISGNEIELVKVTRIDDRSEQFGLWTTSRNYYANGLLSGDAAANVSVLGEASAEMVAKMLASITQNDTASLNNWNDIMP